MVLEIVADCLVFDFASYASLLEDIRIAYSGQFKDLWRLDSATRHNHL
jgi:hypothetical protein